MRLVLGAELDLTVFEENEDIEIVRGKAAITRKVRELFPERLIIRDRLLFQISLQALLSSGEISLAELKRYTDKEGLLEYLQKLGCLGIGVRKPFYL